MQMQHVFASGTLMQVVDILSDYVGVIPLLKVDQTEMSGIRLGIYKFTATLIVEFMHKLGVAGKAVGTRHLHYGILVPKSATVAKSSNSTLGAHACTCRYNQFLFHCAKTFNNNNN